MANEVEESTIVLSLTLLYSLKIHIASLVATHSSIIGIFAACYHRHRANHSQHQKQDIS